TPCRSASRPWTAARSSGSTRTETPGPTPSCWPPTSATSWTSFRRPHNAGPRAQSCRSGDAAAARDGDFAGADQLDQAEWPNHALEGLDLVVCARDLHGHAALRNVHGLAAEDLGELHHLGAGVAVLARDLEQRQLPGNGLLGLEVEDLDTVAQL